jgi:hypothetical protein
MAKLIEAFMRLMPESIQTKIKNIDKAGVEGPLSTARVSSTSRVSIPYHIVKENNLTLLQKILKIGTIVQTVASMRSPKSVGDAIGVLNNANIIGAAF